LILIAVSLLSPLFAPQEKVSEISFSQFLNEVESGKIKQLTIAGEVISGKFTDGKSFETRAVNAGALVPTLREKGIEIKIEPPAQAGWFWNLAIQLILPLAFFALLWFFLIRQAQSSNSQAMSFGRSRAKPLSGKVNVTFADVAGVDEAKEELSEIVEFLKVPEKFQALGAKIPKGLLLMGPPGSGKTLLARAIAGEAGVPFFSLSGSDFVEMFVGVGASRVRDLFTQAKKQSPCIIFMDEIDAVGRHRGAGLGGGHDEREQTLNQLLVEMDGFDPKTNIIVIAATNRPDILDPALLRPGRFDRQVVLDKPDLKGRKEIIKIHMKGKPLAKDIDIGVLARRTPGFTGADIENMLNEAAILAARADKKEITMEELEEAVDRVIAGPEKKSRVINEKEKAMVAHHEVGHALLSRILPNADPVHKVSILPRGMALGYTLQLPLEDKYLITKSEVLDRITVMLGGRVSEEMIFGELTSGAHNDLERATELSKKMVCEFGMSKLGPRTFGKKDRQIFLGRDIAEMKDYGEETADAIDKEVISIVDECHGRAKKLLTENRDKLEAIAKKLIEKETLDGEELEKTFNGLGLKDKKSEKTSK
jgi:cell division protease FtsH